MAGPGGDTVLAEELAGRMAGQPGQEEPNMRISHYFRYQEKSSLELLSRYEEDTGIRLGVDSIAGLSKAWDDKYTQVYLEVGPD